MIMEKSTIGPAQIFSEERFTKMDIFKSRNSSMFMLNFNPGQAMESHGHPGKELYLHVLEGHGALTIDDRVVEVSAGDVVHLEADETIGFENGGDRTSIYVTMNRLNG